jgi:hypothetical protein
VEGSSVARWQRWVQASRRSLLRVILGILPGLTATMPLSGSPARADGSTAIVGGPGRRRQRRRKNERDHEQSCKTRPAAKACRGRCGKVVSVGCGKTLNCSCGAGKVCTTDAGVCCAADRVCGRERSCCAEGEICGPGDACCPLPQLCLPSNVCCAAGQVCAPGGGVCCNPAQICTVGGVANACCSGTCIGGICTP